MSATGIDLHFGISESTLDQSEAKKIMNKNSDMCIYLLDNTKFNKKGINKTLDIKEVDIIITNKLPENDFLKYFKQNNINIIY